MDSDLIRSYLISGCQRESNLAYPNIQWGFGKVNLYGTFEVIKESALDFNTMIEEGDFSQWVMVIRLWISIPVEALAIC